MAFRAVIVDVGGVLSTSVPDGPLRRRWELRLGLEPGGLADLIFGSDVGFQAARGAATPADVWRWIAEQFALSDADRATLAADFWRETVWDEPLLAFLRGLKPRCKLGVLSDAWADMRASVAPWINAETFDAIVISAEEGLLKPDPELFRRALARLDVAPQAAIFVDDRPKNVEGARALGIHALLFTGSAAIQAQITQLLAAE